MAVKWINLAIESNCHIIFLMVWISSINFNVILIVRMEKKCVIMEVTWRSDWNEIIDLSDVTKL